MKSNECRTNQSRPKQQGDELVNDQVDVNDSDSWNSWFDIPNHSYLISTDGKPNDPFMDNSNIELHDLDEITISGNVSDIRKMSHGCGTRMRANTPSEPKSIVDSTARNSILTSSSFEQNTIENLDYRNEEVQVYGEISQVLPAVSNTQRLYQQQQQTMMGSGSHLLGNMLTQEQDTFYYSVLPNHKLVSSLQRTYSHAALPTNQNSLVSHHDQSLFKNELKAGNIASESNYMNNYEPCVEGSQNTILSTSNEMEWPAPDDSFINDELNNFYQAQQSLQQQIEKVQRHKQMLHVQRMFVRNELQLIRMRKNERVLRSTTGDPDGEPTIEDTFQNKRQCPPESPVGNEGPNWKSKIRPCDRRLSLPFDGMEMQMTRVDPTPCPIIDSLCQKSGALVHCRRGLSLDSVTQPNYFQQGELGHGSLLDYGNLPSYIDQDRSFGTTEILTPVDVAYHHEINNSSTTAALDDPSIVNFISSPRASLQRSELAFSENHTLQRNDATTLIGNQSTVQLDCQMTAMQKQWIHRRGKTFPMKLMQTIVKLNNDESLIDRERIIAWFPDGKTIVFVDPDRFMQYFASSVKQIQYSSFTRKLHRWGFQRTSPGSGLEAYNHPYFHRDHPDLAIYIESIRDATDNNRQDLHLEPIQSHKKKPPPPSLNVSLDGMKFFLLARSAQIEETDDKITGS